MQKIMLATDFSERSDRAMRRAVLLAKEQDALLDLVHVVDDDRPRRFVDHEAADARDLLDRQVETLASIDGVRATSEVIQADPFAGIVRASTDRAPDLLVLGPHRRQLLRDAFIGTTAERALRKVGCPVLTVNAPPVGPYRHVLLTTDLSEASGAALQRYLDLGLFPDARHSVLHVFDVPALRLPVSDSLSQADRDHYIASQAAESRGMLETFLQGLRGRSLMALVRHSEVTDADEVLKAAEQTSADLLVMATRGRGGFARMMLGSVTEQVLQRAGVDVLTLPPEAGL